MRTHCSVCGGKGTIADPSWIGRTVMYSGPNGERVPQMTCPNCQGAKFVGVPDVPFPIATTPRGGAR